MKQFGRNFSRMEKSILLVLILFLMAFGYYQFVDKPVRRALDQAERDKQDLQTEIEQSETLLLQLTGMKNELDKIQSEPTYSRMESYNASKQEIGLLNDILKNAQRYNVSFAEVSRKGDQIRRPFALQYTAKSYRAAKAILEELTNSPYRCIVKEVNMTSASGEKADLTSGEVGVSLTAIFYETMVGGIEDDGLPKEKVADEEIGELEERAHAYEE